MTDQNTSGPADVAGDEELFRRFSSIDAALAKDIGRRRRNRRVYWLLLVAAVGIAVTAWLFGPSGPEEVAHILGRDPQLTQRIAAEPTLASAVADAPEVKRQMAETARAAATDAAGTAAFARNLADNPIFAESVGPAALQAFEAQPQLQERLSAVIGGADPELGVRLGDLAAEVAELREMTEALRAAGPRPELPIDSRWTALAAQQEQLAQRLERQLELSSRSAERLDRLAAELAALQKQLERSVGAHGLEADQDALASRSYLLKENAENRLPGLGLTVSLGRQGDALIEDVRVSDDAGLVFPGAAEGRLSDRASVRLGSPFEFRDHQGVRYAAVFTYTQWRFLRRDFVGLDVYRLTD